MFVACFAAMFFMKHVAKLLSALLAHQKKRKKVTQEKTPCKKRGKLKQ
jgi:hypothetical protein